MQVPPHQLQQQQQGTKRRRPSTPSSDSHSSSSSESDSEQSQWIHKNDLNPERNLVHERDLGRYLSESHSTTFGNEVRVLNVMKTINRLDEQKSLRSRALLYNHVNGVIGGKAYPLSFWSNRKASSEVADLSARHTGQHENISAKIDDGMLVIVEDGKAVSHPLQGMPAGPVEISADDVLLDYLKNKAAIRKKEGAVVATVKDLKRWECF